MSALRAAWAVARNDLALGRARPLGTALSFLVPLNFLLLFVLFALSGGVAPVATYSTIDGHPAQPLVSALQHSSTYRVQQLPSRRAADGAVDRADAVAAIGLPPGSSCAGRRTPGVNVQLSIDNLNADFADDVRRGLPLALRQLCEQTSPGAFPITAAEHDSYPRTVSFLDYLAVSILTVALVLGGLLQGGLGAAAEWERGTVRELLLAPVPTWAIVLGKLAGGFAGALVSAVLVLAALFGLGVRPHAWGQLGYTAVMLLLLFTGLGVAAGSRLRSARAVVPFAFALGLPLFIVSGAFGPISWQTSMSSTVARVFPVAYANAAIQRAVHGVLPIATTPKVLWLVLAGWGVVGLVISTGAYRRADGAH